MRILELIHGTAGDTMCVRGVSAADPLFGAVNSALTTTGDGGALRDRAGPAGEKERGQGRVRQAHGSL